MHAMRSMSILIPLFFLVCAALISCGGDDDPSASSGQANDDMPDDDTDADDDDADDDADDDLNDDVDDDADDDVDDDVNDDIDDDAFDALTYVGDLPVLRLKGDAYARGYGLGEAIGGDIVFLYEEYILKYALGLSPEYCNIFEGLRNLACGVLKYTDEELRQMEGIAEGIRDHWQTEITLSDGTVLEFNKNDVCIANALADFAQIACSSVSAWGDMTEDGETIIARNLDWGPGPDNLLGQATVVISETPEDESWNFVSVTFPGFIGCLSCMNGDGDAAFIHDTSRWHSEIAIAVEPRVMMARRALLAAQGAQDDFAAFEGVIEAADVDTGNNFHFVRAADAGDRAAACFEVDDNETHPDGFATLRTDLDTAASGTGLQEVFFVTNNHRKRYGDPSGCWRYDSMLESVETIVNEQRSPLTLDDLHEAVKKVEFVDPELTVQTILFKPSDMTLKVFRLGPDHLASEDEGVTVPVSVLYPWN
jgi:hypothetical protein